MGADYHRVLDLYAGTGALGIEALSRGDGTADFVESDAEAARLVEANLRATGLAARGRVHRMRAEAAARLEGPYTLVLADPPYYDTGAFAAVAAAARPPLVAPGSVLVVEHHKRAEWPERLGAMARYRERRHGDTTVSIYEYAEAERGAGA